MKLSLFVLALVITGALLTAADAPAPVTVISPERVTAALATSGTLAKNSQLIVMCQHRSGPGQVEVHDKQTDVIYVVDGEGTMITGGKMIGGKVTGPGQWRGTSIEGGQEHHVVKGEFMVIPAGTPHWFKAVPHSISYTVVKVLTQ